MKRHEKVNIFGINMSRRELFINGIIFLMVDVAFSVIGIIKQIPEGWRDNPELLESVNVSGGAITASWWISMALFVASYLLLSRSIFGGGKDREIAEKDGVGTLLFKKFLLIFIMVMTEVLLQIGITLLVT